MSENGFVANIYGLSSLMLFGAAQQIVLPHPSRSEKLAISELQDKLWDIGGEPLPGFVHKIWKEDATNSAETKGPGAAIHYIERKERVPGAKTIVFIHGFPNTFFVYYHTLTSPAFAGYNLVAINNPSYGGSPGLPPNETKTSRLFPILSSFLAHISKEYAPAPPPFLISHDWGAILSAGFVSVPEHKSLVSGIVMINGVVAPLAVGYLREQISTFKANFKRAQMGSAFNALGALCEQALKSFYIPMFRMPLGLRRFFLPKRFFHGALMYDAKKNKEDVIFDTAIMIGPKPSDPFWATLGIKEKQDVELFEMMRWYREGLFEELVNIPEPKPEDRVRRLVIWGKNDIALSERMSLAGIPAEEIKIIDGGHHGFVREGREEFEKVVVEWLEGKEQSQTKDNADVKIELEA